MLIISPIASCFYEHIWWLCLCESRVEWNEEREGAWETKRMKRDCKTEQGLEDNSGGRADGGIGVRQEDMQAGLTFWQRDKTICASALSLGFYLLYPQYPWNSETFYLRNNEIGGMQQNYSICVFALLCSVCLKVLIW